MRISDDHQRTLPQPSGLSSGQRIPAWRPRLSAAPSPRIACAAAVNEPSGLCRTSPGASRIGVRAFFTPRSKTSFAGSPVFGQSGKMIRAWAAALRHRRQTGRHHPGRHDQRQAAAMAQGAALSRPIQVAINASEPRLAVSRAAIRRRRTVRRMIGRVGDRMVEGMREHGGLDAIRDDLDAGEAVGARVRRRQSGHGCRRSPHRWPARREPARSGTAGRRPRRCPPPARARSAEPGRRRPAAPVRSRCESRWQAGGRPPGRPADAPP